MSSPNPNLFRKELRTADIQSYLSDIRLVSAALSAENLRPSTCANYESFLKIFASWLVLHANGVSFRDVDLDTVRMFVEFLKNSLLLAPNTVNGYLAAIRKMYAVVRRQEVSKRILPDLAVDTRLPHVPSTEQAGRLVDVCRTNRELLFITILLSTGMRLCEVLNLQFRDILRDRKLIYIRTSKGRMDGYVPLTDRVLKLLSVYCQEYLAAHTVSRLSPEHYVFFSADPGTPEKAHRIRRDYYEIMKAAGMAAEGFNIHSLRHYYALNLYLQSHDPILVKRALRHKTYAATEKYVLLAVSAEIQAKYTNPGEMAFQKSRRYSEEKQKGNHDELYR